jgi:hypothetical protein
MGQKLITYEVVVANLEGKRPVGRPKRIWLEIFKLDVEKYDGE